MIFMVFWNLKIFLILIKKKKNVVSERNYFYEREWERERYFWILKCYKNYGLILRMINDKVNLRFFFLNLWLVMIIFYFISVINIDDNVLKWIYIVILRNIIKICCKWEKLFIK